MKLSTSCSPGVGDDLHQLVFIEEMAKVEALGRSVYDVCIL